jgi:hypothetical protein
LRRGKSQPARQQTGARQIQTRRTRAVNKAQMMPKNFQEFGGKPEPRDVPKEEEESFKYLGLLGVLGVSAVSKQQ